MAPFSWRYHAYPLDVCRYTHTGLRYLFESLGGIKTVIAGYSYCGKSKQGHMPGKVDVPPDDKWQQNVETIWIGQRVDGVKFDPESLDHYTDTALESPIAPSLPDG